MRRFFVDARYGQVHLRESRPAPGSALGAPLICLHLSPKSGWIYQDILPLLAAGRAAFAPDYPGFGESAPPPSEPQVTIEDYAAVMWEVVDTLGGGPVHLLGYHTGSLVAVEMAAQRPDGVISVINISAPIFNADEIAEFNATYRHIDLDEAGTRFMHMWKEILAWNAPGVSLEWSAASLAENLRAGEAYEWGHRAAFNYAPVYRQRLAALAQPTLIINPDDDLKTYTRRAAGLRPGLEVLEAPQWGHGFLSFDAGAAAALINDFLGGNE
ncbi:MAG: alpha/beta fold hydrolase [Gammaproteobacteria bacterium]|nr:alpha/beta hydrolase [Gammaproteobacteria bacterium]NNL99227.1 alpha/beta fold hydrolase [Gammaproteobacteria bacterium]